MARTEQKKRGNPILLLDSDLLGFAAAALVAAVTAALGFWVGQDFFTVAVRAGIAALVTYVVVFMLVHMILRTSVREMIERRKKEEQERKAAEAAAAAAAAASQAEQAPAKK